MRLRQSSGDVDLAAEMLIEAVPRLMRLISIEAQDDVQNDSLSIPQVRTLGLVIRGLRLPSELARHMQISPASASELVEGLARRSLLTRCEHETDKRCSSLSVTEEGRRCHEASRRRSLAALRKLLAQLDKDEVNAIHNGLAALIDLLPTAHGPERSARDLH